MPNLSKTTIRKMRRVIRAIVANAEYYDQRKFPEAGDCGTTCCAAGFAVWIDTTPKKYKELCFKYDGGQEWASLAASVLGIKEMHYLFASPNSWPLDFFWQYTYAHNPEQKALVLEACWEDFIARDGLVGDEEVIPF